MPSLIGSLTERTCSCGRIFGDFPSRDRHMLKHLRKAAPMSGSSLKPHAFHQFAANMENDCAECLNHRDNPIHTDTGVPDQGPSQEEVDATLASIATALKETGHGDR